MSIKVKMGARRAYSMRGRESGDEMYFRVGGGDGNGNGNGVSGSMDG